MTTFALIGDAVPIAVSGAARCDVAVVWDAVVVAVRKIGSKTSVLPSGAQKSRSETVLRGLPERSWTRI
jgi:hypothetical protein